jgi:hypothetical protein
MTMSIGYLVIGGMIMTAILIVGQYCLRRSLYEAQSEDEEQKKWKWTSTDTYISLGIAVFVISSIVFGYILSTTGLTGHCSGNSACAQGRGCMTAGDNIEELAEIVSHGGGRPRRIANVGNDSGNVNVTQQFYSPVPYLPQNTLPSFTPSELPRTIPSSTAASTSSAFQSTNVLQPPTGSIVNQPMMPVVNVPSASAPVVGVKPAYQTMGTVEL